MFIILIKLRNWTYEYNNLHDFSKTFGISFFQGLFQVWK